MITHRLILDYTLQPGWMTPFVDSLRAGEVCARQCNTCAHITYPPLRTCSCGSDRGDWVDLPGDARILFRSDGSDGSFGLVQFAGADTKSVARLDGIAPQHQTGILGKQKGDLPMINLIPAPTETS